MAPSVNTTIDITAPPTAVWEVLTDYGRYPEWNPFIVNMSGDKKVGGRLTTTMKPPNGSSGMTFTPLIHTFTPNVHLHWKGRLMNIPGLFTGHHHFVLHPTETGTRVEQSEQFSGILALVLHWIGSDMYETTERGFVLMNEALKRRVEERDDGGKLGVETSAVAED